MGPPCLRRTNETADHLYSERGNLRDALSLRFHLAGTLAAGWPAHGGICARRRSAPAVALARNRLPRSVEHPDTRTNLDASRSRRRLDRDGARAGPFAANLQDLWHLSEDGSAGGKISSFASSR
ncbi:hypothetical protein IE4872_PD01496 (plasmid) [Rhizobium gallicum]|uniref:Uncharacterized protein n=1 Tax=Rhizobium gallicum TaxID=56730 RepID=A0A1L5NVX5_9HYPH|nr:hypothetical protein IE4872_PD01496 [Rhizobium gallicum]